MIDAPEIHPTSTLPADVLARCYKFLDNPGYADKREEFIRRGLIPTNSFGNWIGYDPGIELSPGRPNPHDYRNEPFGPIIESFRTQHYNLWEQAHSAEQLLRKVSKQYSALIQQKKYDEAATVELAMDEAYWVGAEVYSTAFSIIAPQMLAEGFDPLVLCI